MRPVTESVTGVGFTPSIQVDYRQPQFKVGIGCVISGTVLYTVQHTFDDQADFSGASDYETNATWFDNATIAGANDNQDTNYAYPIRAVRVENEATSTGTTTITLLQGS